LAGSAQSDSTAWIRINLLGYTPGGIKAAVCVSSWPIPPPTFASIPPSTFELVDAKTSKVVYRAASGKDFGAYGPFTHSRRLDFSAFRREGTFFLRCGKTLSPVFRIAADIYAGSADFILRYLRQQRSGYNPFLQDSCHTHDGYTMYGPMPDTTRIDVAGGWHDATDYLQYVTTSANATYHLLTAYRDFPEVFADAYQANGRDGHNGLPDVLDEADWGLTWLEKMHPREDWLFHQLADDRDHHGFRLPAKDSVDYGVGPGLGRPVYFATGRPQGLGKYRNRSDGVANIAGKFASAFALGASLHQGRDSTYARRLRNKAFSAYRMGLAQPGVCQTAPNREPYFYEEESWTDDMELAAAALYRLTGDSTYYRQSLRFSTQEKVTPWMGADTARHYQWYPFHNFGHYELSNAGKPADKAILASYYRDGIDRVWRKARQNAFFRGVPFIWCSNNLTVSFAIQCYLYRQLSGDRQFAGLEQACIDWIFGCNPWGRSMVYGLPATGDSPLHPHSSLSYLYHYPLDGGMVDGPVSGSIYDHLRGLRLYQPDRFAAFQSATAVYHDDAGDYSTNEPTTDGSASLVYLLAARQREAEQTDNGKVLVTSHGAIVRGDPRRKSIALVFTADSFGDGAASIARTLKEEKIHASFFFTGNFLRDPANRQVIQRLQQQGNYLGSHSDKHLLYNDWVRRDSLLVTHREFDEDLTAAYRELRKFNIDKRSAPWFLPPYEWYNDSIAAWTAQAGLRLVNFTPGTRSNADYTYPEMGPSYLSSDTIFRSILQYEAGASAGLNGFILLLHAGVDPRRKDKFYLRLPELIKELKARGYGFVKIGELTAAQKP
jgi:peptidoglycan/xylan/chitin deacetylase (PgdA/CDA1 family)